MVQTTQLNISLDITIMTTLDLYAQLFLKGLDMLYNLKVTRQGLLRLMKTNCYKSTHKYVREV